MAQTFGPNVAAALRAPVSARKARKVLELRRVLVAIAAHLDAGRVDPTIRDLAAQVELPVMTVIFAVDRLEAGGFLKVERTPNERNRYKLGKRSRRFPRQEPRS